MNNNKKSRKNEEKKLKTNKKWEFSILVSSMVDMSNCPGVMAETSTYPQRSSGSTNCEHLLIFHLIFLWKYFMEIFHGFLWIFFIFLWKYIVTYLNEIVGIFEYF